MDTQLIIFDFDGTLADTRATIIQTMQTMMEQLHLEVKDESACAATIGLPLRTGFEKLYPALPTETLDRCVESYRKIFNQTKEALSPQPFPRAIETLDSLHRQGIALTIASSRSNASLQDFVSQLNLSEYISFVLGVEDVTHAKPDPEPVLKTLKHMGITAAHTLVVGDMPVDIHMGAGAGARTCAVTYGNATRAQLKEAHPNFIIDDLSELLQIIR